MSRNPLAQLTGCVLGVVLCSQLSAARVTLDEDEWDLKNSEHGLGELREAVVQWHEAWAARDLQACRAILDPEILRAVAGAAEPLLGRDEVLAALPLEWSAFEPDAEGGSALALELREVKVWHSADAALLHYYADVSGGSRWQFGDSFAYAAIFRRHATDGRWRLVFEGSAPIVSTPDESDEDVAERSGFAYDFVMPVDDLDRAMRFYQGLVGRPEAVVAGVAAYELNGSRLYLDSTAAAPGQAARSGLPNGWPIIIPDDPERARRQASAAGVSFSSGLRRFGDHQLQFGFEPGGNLVALALSPTSAARPASLAPELSPSLQGRTPPAELRKLEREIRLAMLAEDGETLAQVLGKRGVLLDATGAAVQGWQRSSEALEDWAGETEGSATLAPVHVASAGPFWVFVRQRTLIGPSPWRRQAHALQSLVLDARKDQLALGLTVAARPTPALGIDFDYAGLPATVAGWEVSAAALRALTGADDEYEDEGWLGLWGTRAVLGLFEADPDEDGLPRPRAASAYLSIWVSDIDAALAFARKAGAGLPVLPAINDQPGIDRNPGYAQVYLTDSEGNGLVLTEYTGRTRARACSSCDESD